MDIRRVLCPVDLSECSERALDCAAVIGRRFGAAVTALHVAAAESMPVRPYAGPVAPEPITWLSHQQEQLVLAVHAFVAPQVACGLPVEARIAQGDPVHTILDHAGALPADLLVIGSHGRSGLSRVVLGSVAEEVIARASCPVLTIPPHAPAAVPARRSLFSHLLCAFDYSPGARAATAYAVSLAQHLGSEMTLLYVREQSFEDTLPPSEDEYGDTTEQVRELERRAAERLAREIPPGACGAEAIVAIGEPAVQILRQGRARGADLIVMGVERRGAVDRMLFGSTTRAVIREATCPVLTLRAS